MAEVYRSSVVSASANRVWDAIRDFNALPTWLPIVTESRIESGAPADQVGCVRAFRLQDGGMIREKLIGLSDYDYSFSYSILESPMSVTHYLATLRLIPVTDGDRTFIEWQAEFECPADKESALVTQIGDGVFQVGLDALKRHFGS